MGSTSESNWGLGQKKNLVQNSRRGDVFVTKAKYSPNFLSACKQVQVAELDTRSDKIAVKYQHGCFTTTDVAKMTRVDKIDYVLDQMGVGLWSLVFHEWNTPKKLLANMFTPGGVKRYRELQTKVIHLIKANKFSEIEALASSVSQA